MPTRDLATGLLACSHWIFDLDGTLTLPVHDFDAIRVALNIPKGRMILEYIAEQDPHRQQKMLTTLDAIEVELAKRAKPAAGCLALLNTLQRNDVKLGIVTRNSRANALTSLEAIGALHFFEVQHILGRDEAAPKPDPSGLLHLMNQWRCAPQKSVMVGDSHMDLQAGRAAGAWTLHVRNGVDRASRPSDLELIDHAVDALTDITTLLRSKYSK